MTGASEELPGGLACGVLPGGLTEQELEAMPEGLMIGPHTCLEIGDRYTNDQVWRLGVVLRATSACLSMHLLEEIWSE